MRISAHTAKFYAKLIVELANKEMTYRHRSMYSTTSTVHHTVIKIRNIDTEKSYPIIAFKCFDWVLHFHIKYLIRSFHRSWSERTLRSKEWINWSICWRRRKKNLTAHLCDLNSRSKEQEKKNSTSLYKSVNMISCGTVARGHTQNIKHKTDNKYSHWN